MKLKEILRKEIRNRGMTLKALSLKSGVPTATLSNWLQGAKPRDIDQVKSVGRVFQLSVDELAYGDEAKEFSSKEFSIKDIQKLGRFDVFLKKVRDGNSTI